MIDLCIILFLNNHSTEFHFGFKYAISLKCQYYRTHRSSSSLNGLQCQDRLSFFFVQIAQYSNYSDNVCIRQVSRRQILQRIQQRFTLGKYQKPVYKHTRTHERRRVHTCIDTPLQPAASSPAAGDGGRKLRQLSRQGRTGS